MKCFVMKMSPPNKWTWSSTCAHTAHCLFYCELSKHLLVTTLPGSRKQGTWHYKFANGKEDKHDQKLRWRQRQHVANERAEAEGSDSKDEVGSWKPKVRTSIKVHRVVMVIVTRTATIVMMIIPDTWMPAVAAMMTRVTGTATMVKAIGITMLLMVMSLMLMIVMTLASMVMITKTAEGVPDFLEVA